MLKISLDLVYSTIFCFHHGFSTVKLRGNRGCKELHDFAIFVIRPLQVAQLAPQTHAHPHHIAVQHLRARRAAVDEEKHMFHVLSEHVLLLILTHHSACLNSWKTDMRIKIAYVLTVQLVQPH